MRFRLLSDLELKELSEDFTQFLIVQGLDDETWRKINKENNKYEIHKMSALNFSFLCNLIFR